MYDHKNTTTMRQSLRLIEVEQCLCTDPYSLPFIMHPASHVQLVRRIPDFKASEAATEHTSPFCVRTKKHHLRIRVQVNVKKCVDFVQKRLIRIQNMCSLSSQALRE